MAVILPYWCRVFGHTHIPNGDGDCDYRRHDLVCWGGSPA